MKFRALILTAFLLFTSTQTFAASFVDNHQSVEFNQCCCRDGYYCGNEYGCNYDDECGRNDEGCYRR